jgi:hypothetical protein
VYDRGFVRGFSTMGTPVRPGMSRVFGRFSFGSFKPAADGKKTLMQQLMTKLPHWVFIRNTLPDQDTVVNVKQVWARVWFVSCVVRARACEHVV